MHPTRRKTWANHIEHSKNLRICIGFSLYASGYQGVCCNPVTPDLQKHSDNTEAKVFRTSPVLEWLCRSVPLHPWCFRICCSGVAWLCVTMHCNRFFIVWWQCFRWAFVLHLPPLQCCRYDFAGIRKAVTVRSIYWFRITIAVFSLQLCRTDVVLSCISTGWPPWKYFTIKIYANNHECTAMA